jgi:hypothetical protein
MPSIIWNDKTEMSAPTWDALLEKIRKDQPDPTAPICDDLAKRAWVWSGTVVETDNAETLFVGLQAAGLLTITKEI